MDVQLLVEELSQSILRDLFEGGPGSGHWGHGGRPGAIGGSAPGGGGPQRGAKGVTTRIGKLNRSGGFSFRPWGSKVPSDGYIVSRKGHGINFNGPVSGKKTHEWVDKQWDFVKGNAGRYYGGWVDGKAAQTYLDISEKFDNKEKALSLAKRTGELAIWDVKNSQELRV